MICICLNKPKGRIPGIEQHFEIGETYEFKRMEFPGVFDPEINYRVRIEKDWFQFSPERFHVVFKEISKYRNEKLEKLLS